MGAPNFPMFPGLTARNLVSKDVIELVTTFNSEGLAALQTIPEAYIRWADVATRVTPGVSIGIAKIPVRLSPILGFKPFTGERQYHQTALAAVSVPVTKFDLNYEWPIELSGTGAPTGLANYYGVQGLAGDVVQHARALKADLVANLIINGLTHANAGTTGHAVTIAQPGYPNGLPLFIMDGDATGGHFANPLDAKSKRFFNAHHNVGKITDTGVMGRVLTDMSQVPHAIKANMVMGLGVTDLIGPTNMLLPFWMLAIQQLSMQTTTVPASLAAATTNIYSPESLKLAQQYTGAPGLAPWRFWIAPQLDSHPYVINNPTEQMWLAVSQSTAGGAFCEMAAPTKEMTPYIKVLGDGSEEAAKSGMVRMINDMAGGAAAGLAHLVQLYFSKNLA